MSPLLQRGECPRIPYQEGQPGQEGQAVKLGGQQRIRPVILQELLKSSEHIYEKREGSGSGAGSVSIPLTSGSDPGGRSGSGSPTRRFIMVLVLVFLSLSRFFFVSKICLLL
jgi:hypothetical protein